MKLFSYSTENGSFQIGVETPKGLFNLTRAFDIYQQTKRVHNPMVFAFLQVMVEMGYATSKSIQQIMSDPWVQSKQEDLRLKPGFRFNLPITRPSKIICLGRNYRAHAKELNHTVPEEPVLFSKAPSALIPHEADIVIPEWLDGRVDHEAELALIIGKEAKNISEEEALVCIAGYTILNDVTARDMQKSDLEKHEPWFRSKSLDTFCPVGPSMTLADESIDPHSLDIRLTVNGVEKQSANTSSMIFKIQQVISYISRFMTLNPGDIIATGTPEGVSPIKVGDEIEITITGLGTLKNRVVKK